MPAPGNDSTLFDFKSASLTLEAFLLKTGNLTALDAALTERFGATPDIFNGEPVVIDLTHLASLDVPVSFPTLLALLQHLRSEHARWPDDLKRVVDWYQPHLERLLKAAMARPIDKGTTFVTGGDVSRFQRSSVPPKNVQYQQSAQAAAPAPARAGGSDANAAPVYRGPSVRVTRGKETEDTQVSAKANGTAILSSQSSGVRRAGQRLPAAGATVIN